jgi:hypothetical protein
MNTGWAIFQRCNHMALHFTFRRTRSESVREVEKSFNRSWRKLKREGLYCRRAVLLTAGGGAR